MWLKNTLSRRKGVRNVRLSKNTFMFINLGPLLLEKTKGEDICEYFCTNKVTRSGHYTEKGNRVLAEVAQELLARLGALVLRRQPGVPQ